MTRKDLWHGSTLPRPILAAGKDGGIHLGSRDQAAMRNPAFLHRVAFDTGRERRSRDCGGDWSARISAARRAGCTSVVYLNRWEGVLTESLERMSGMSDPDSLADAAWRRAFPECTDSWIALYPEDVRVLEIVPGRGSVTLWHGATEASARDLLRNGYRPGGPLGLLKLSTDPGDARLISNELGADVVLKIRVPAEDLIVDPELGRHAEPWRELCDVLPGKVATWRPLPGNRITKVEIAPRDEPQTALMEP